MDSEKLGGEPVGGVADCVELVERQKKLGEAGVDPAEEIYQDIQGVPKKRTNKTHKNGETCQAPQRFKVVQRSPKVSEVVNLDVF